MSSPDHSSGAIDSGAIGSGVGSSHASWVRAISFSLCFRGGGGDESARGEEREEGGYRTVRKCVITHNIFLPDWNEVRAAQSPSPMMIP